MSLWIGVAVTFAALNVLLLAALSAIWLRNYRTFRTNLLLGLLLFAGLLAMENLVAMVAYLSTDMIYAGTETAKYATVGLRIMQFGAIAFLAAVTLFPSGHVFRALGVRSKGEHN